MGTNSLTPPNSPEMLIGSNYGHALLHFSGELRESHDLIENSDHHINFAVVIESGGNHL